MRKTLQRWLIEHRDRQRADSIAALAAAVACPVGHRNTPDDLRCTTCGRDILLRPDVSIAAVDGLGARECLIAAAVTLVVFFVPAPVVVRWVAVLGAMFFFVCPFALRGRGSIGLMVAGVVGVALPFVRPLTGAPVLQVGAGVLFLAGMILWKGTPPKRLAKERAETSVLWIDKTIGLLDSESNDTRH